MASGLYQHLLKPPYCPGLEYSGVVQSIGSDVSRHSVGDRVMLDGLLAGPRSSSAYQQYGGYASYAVAPETGLPAITVPMGFVRHATLPAGLQILGDAWSEPLLIRIAYAFEQATHHRKPPPTTPPLGN